MTRIYIQDLPKDLHISKEEMKKVVGGVSSSLNWNWYSLRTRNKAGIIPDGRSDGKIT